MLKIKLLALGTLQTNCYILFDELSKEAAIIDPASEADVIMSNISKTNLTVKYIIITHAHADHIKALDEIKKETCASILIGQNDKEALNDNVLSLCTQFGFKAPKSEADIVLKENDVLTLGREEITVIETPGHTKGCICLKFDGGLISGDTLFFESVGRWDFPGGDFKALMKSIKEKLFVFPDDTPVYPGHGSATSIGHEKLHNTLVI